MLRRLAVLLTVFILTALACGDDDTGGSTTNGDPSTTSGFGGATTTSAGGQEYQPAVLWVSGSGGVARLDLGAGSCEVTPAGLGNDLVGFGLGRVWVTDCAGRQLLAIDVDNGAVVGRRDLGGCASDLAIGESSIFVTVPETSRVLEIDAASGEIVDESPYEGSPSSIALGSRAVGTFEGTVFYENAIDWDRAFTGVIYDLQFYGDALWVLENEFGGEGHDVVTSRLWAIDPAVGDPVLYAEVPVYLNGILVTDFGVWANSLAVDLVARWEDEDPAIGAAPVGPRWSAADSPSKVRIAGGHVFTTHHASQRATRIDQAAAGHDWGAVANGVAPSLWDQPGTQFYELSALCDPSLYPSDIAGASTEELAAARTAAAGHPEWNSDPAPEGPMVRNFFAECSVGHSDGMVTASGRLDQVPDGAMVDLSLVAPDGTVHALGSLPVSADGTFEFPEVRGPISPPFTVQMTSGSAVCEIPVE